MYLIFCIIWSSLRTLSCQANRFPSWIALHGRMCHTCRALSVQATFKLTGQSVCESGSLVFKQYHSLFSPSIVVVVVAGFFFFILAVFLCLSTLWFMRSLLCFCVTLCQVCGCLLYNRGFFLWRVFGQCLILLTVSFTADVTQCHSQVTKISQDGREFSFMVTLLLNVTVTWRTLTITNNTATISHNSMSTATFTNTTVCQLLLPNHKD